MDAPAATDPGRIRVGRIAIVITVLALALMWIYVFSRGAGDDAPDQLDDPSFAVAAEEICSGTRDQLERLPGVTEESPPEELADVVDDANEALRAMVDELATVAPDADRDRRLVTLWLEDWDVYLGDREEWAAEVRVCDVGVFTETDRGGAPISETIDTFAAVNDMPSCEAP
jgi:hypothetical protein